MLAIASDVDPNPTHLPEKTEPDSQTPRVLSILSFVLDRLVNRNEMLSLTTGGGGGGGGVRLGKNLEVFHGVRPPAISVAKYLDRIYKYTNCSPACFVVGYIYIDRLVHRHPGSLVVSLNVHRLLVTSIMLAAKVLDDEYVSIFPLRITRNDRPALRCGNDCFRHCHKVSTLKFQRHYNNAFYARVGGITNAELNRLEVEFLFMLDFDLTVTSRVFESYCLYLEREMITWNGKDENGSHGAAANTIEDIAEISVEDMDSLPSPVSNGVLA